MVQLILLFGRFCDWEYAGLLRFGLKYIDVTAAIFSNCGNKTYLNQLSQERELLKAQLDRLEVRYG